MPLICRSVTPQDRELFMSALDAFYRSPATLHGISRAQQQEIFELSCKQSPYYRALLLEYAGEMAGYAHLSFTHSNEAFGMVLLLEELFILPSMRGKGIGNAFFDWMFAEYKGKIKRFRLEVTPENQGAIRLYQKRGFKVLPYAQMILEV